MKQFLLYAWFFLFLLLVGCQTQAVVELPTLAVLPTLTASPVPERDLIFWQLADGTLATSNQVDRWSFIAQANDPIRITTLGTVNLTLVAPSGQVISNGPTIEATLATTGRYVLTVQGEPGRYQLGLAYTDRPNPVDFTVTPPPVTVGVPTPTPVFSELGLFIAELTPDVAATEKFLASPIQPHVYTFEGRAETYLTVEMNRLTGTFDPVLTLYGPTGDPLAIDNGDTDSAMALLRNVPLRTAGRYSLQATGSTGDYEIRLQLDDRPLPVTPTIIAPPTATPLPIVPSTNVIATAAPNEVLQPYIPVMGSLARVGDVKRHALQVAEGDFVTLGVRKIRAESNISFAVEVYDPTGERVGVSTGRIANAGGDTVIPLLPIEQTGTYSVFVTAEGNAFSDYIIAYGFGPNFEDQQRGPTSADQPYESQIGKRGFRDVWQVNLNAGDAITIAANPLNRSLDPIIELFAPDGSLVTSDDNSGGYPNALIAEATAPVTGVHHIIVSAASGITAGPYRLVWRYLTVAPTPTYAAPRIQLFTMDDQVPIDEYRFYPFQGTAGERVRIQVLGVAPGLDPVAVLIGPDGDVIAEGDDSDGDLNPRFIADLPADGTYQVRVNGYLSGGRFELIVEQLF